MAGVKTRETNDKPGEGTRLVDEYIAGFPGAIQERLQKIRQTIRKGAPKAEEAIKYCMPAFLFHGHLVYFAAFKNHIGFFPTGAGIEEFQKELAGFKWSKGTIQFPHGEKLPLGLVSRIVKFRVRQNLEKATKEKVAAKAKKTPLVGKSAGRSAS